MHIQLETADTPHVFPVRRRLDLRVSARRRGGRGLWTVKDPVALRYFLLRDEEFTILNLLDGKRTLLQIQREFARRLPPLTLDGPSCLQFARQLHSDGLVEVDEHGQGQQLFRRHCSEQHSASIRRWSSLLAFRWRGINPDPLLRRIDPFWRWCFSPLAGLVGAILIVFAGILVATRLESLLHATPEFFALFASQHLALMLLVVVVVKLVHELAHALTLRHFGGECHEMGIVFVLGVPFPYCNVTDSWMFATTWHRVAVAGAGVYAELIMASLAAIVWAATEPGAVHAVSRAILLMCSISTLFINGNPLMRFDGYFILSDLLGMPNLWSDSRGQIRSAIWRGLTGERLSRPWSSKPLRPVLTFGYAIASGLYQVGLLFALWLILRRVFTVFHMSEFFPIVTTVLLCCVTGPWFVAISGLLGNPSRRSSINGSRLVFSVMAIAGMGGILLAIPLPCHVRCRGEVTPSQAQTVYVTTPGTLVHAVREGERVQAGQVLAGLKNRSIELFAQQAKNDLEQQEHLVHVLSARQIDDTESRRQLPVAQREREYLQERWRERSREVDELTLRAPSEGIVFPAAIRSEEPSDGERLTSWNGSPLDNRNHKCLLEAGTPMCMVGHPDRRELLLILDQSQIDLIERGQRLGLRLEGRSGSLLGTIEDIARKATVVTARDLDDPRMAGGAIDPSTLDQPMKAVYEVRASLDDRTEAPLVGTTGRVRIRVAPRSLWHRLSRFVNTALRR